ncbi:hypothetical protein GO988_12535 [Hymenobacter sp. HMF4947]|uniref:Uncharacterized protein n=1 Tax=Hymenobacter ginkgonis TaxID=2682976 RepID=A0A7K1TFJ8_9BACT|nr:hypothetical protein [Hymenobacter ginkgonis]MVN77155.1 hypothetical protein [Hymenobacter ginkgonis]
MTKLLVVRFLCLAMGSPNAQQAGKVDVKKEAFIDDNGQRISLKFHRLGNLKEALS